MKVYLLKSKKVEIHPDSLEVGGSWSGEPMDDIPCAYSIDMIEFLFNILSRYDHPKLMDIGANTGSFCLLPALDRTIRCWAFEPQPAIHKILKENIKLNGIQENVKTYQVALSDKNEKVELNCSVNKDESGFACMGSKPSRCGLYSSIKVIARKLDSIAGESFIPPADVIKIDTEGCEVFVLKGAEKYIRQNMPALLIEFLHENTIQFNYHPREIEKLLRYWGYTSFRKISKEDVFVESPKINKNRLRKPIVRKRR